jgi:NADH-quinone oxidoreductase subunit I
MSLGSGIIQGLVETARNFIGSYTDPEQRLTTVQYPEEKLAPKENGRNFPILIFDGSDAQAGLRCVACQICEKECPPKCIYIVKSKDKKPPKCIYIVKSKDKKPDYIGKPQFYPAIFDIDISVCMSCQICVEVCPFDAIKMDQEFELSRYDRFEGLLHHKTDLAKPNEYYNRIHPTEASEVDARLAEEKVKAETKAKADAEAKAKAAAAPKPVLPAKTPATAPTTQPPGPEAAVAINAKPTETPGPAKVNPAPAESSTTNAAQSKAQAAPPSQPNPEAKP